MKRKAPLAVLVSLLLSAVLSALACAGAPNSRGAEVPLENTIWVLDELGESGKLKAPISGTRITIRFDARETLLGGSGGCNNYGGSYEISSTDTLTVQDLKITLIACDNRVNEQETQYVIILSAATGYKLEHRQLTLSGPEGILIFRP
jgi:heat shock protein HslJ